MPGPAPEIKTLILRFRDLVTQPGDTIARHQALIAQKTSVWWGWWNKAGETIPDEVFRSLRTQCQSSEGLALFLLDSGGHQLYRAICREILWSAQHDRIAPSDLSAIPSYYEQQKYLAWFRLTDLSAWSDPSLLGSFSYVEVPQFFEKEVAQYQPFDGKRIFSIDELIQQNRSMWFVREARGEDPSQEISLLDSERLEPSDFPRRYRQSPSRNILWVSDLHYGRHAFPLKPSDSQKSVGSAIEQCMKEDSSLGDLAGVIVSGDLTWQANPQGYQDAHTFFDWQKQWAKLSNIDFIVGPGNHDIAFSENPADKGSPVTIAPEIARRGFEAFYKNLFFKAPNRYLSSGRRILAGNALAVEILSLNSSLLEQEGQFFQGHGFLGDAQLEDAAGKMEWDPNASGPRAFRIVVLHHHLMPVTYRELPHRGEPYSVVLDAEALVRWLVRHRVSLVLHGHMHQPFFARVERPRIADQPNGPWHRFHVVGLGSTGVSREYLGEIGKNTFGLLRFEESHLDLRVYSIDAINPAQKLWGLAIPYGEGDSR